MQVKLRNIDLIGEEVFLVKDDGSMSLTLGIIKSSSFVGVYGFFPYNDYRFSSEVLHKIADIMDTLGASDAKVPS